MNASLLSEKSNPQREGRTIVLGLDSVDLLLMKQWAAQGLLPFFEKLLRNSPLVKLSALSRVLQAALWPSILTGQLPGQHGLYSFTQLTEGTYSLDKTYADHIRGERFYEPLIAHGVRCAVVDIPKDLPNDRFEGIQVVDWGPEFHYWHFETRPVELRTQIESTYGRHLFTDYPGTGSSIESHRKLRAELEQAVLTKSAFVKDLLRRTDLDLIFVVYGEPHKAGHFFWKYMDSSHPDHVQCDAYMRDALLANYQLLDRQFAELAEMLNENDNLLVFSDHGMQANYRGEHFMEALLAKWGLSASAGQARLGGTESPGVATKAVRVIRRSVRNAINAIAPAVGNKLRQKFGVSAMVDWSRTKAFILPTDRNSYVRINLRGREPQGAVAPGAEYAALLQQIEQEFRQLINDETGKPAVEEIFRVQELYPGPEAHRLPDLAILWSSEAPINVLTSPSIGRLEIRANEQRSGNHRPEGFLLARGPAFKTGPSELDGDILQIAPTLLHMHGVPCPGTYQMGALTELMAVAS